MGDLKKPELSPMRPVLHRLHEVEEKYDSVVVGIVLILLHIICCILVWVGICTHIINVKKYLMFPVVFVPVWGVLCVFDPAFSESGSIRSEKRSRRREDEGK